MDAFVRYPDPLLQCAAELRAVDAALLAVGDHLLAAASAAQAYGLAAAHIGEVEPVIIISVAADNAARDYRVMFNPGVVDVAPTTQTGGEGSVSLPGVEVAVDRPVWAEIGYDDAAGQRQTQRLAGFPARVALHEIDQMNGIFFLLRVSRLRRDAALRKFAKLDHGRG